MSSDLSVSSSFFSNLYKSRNVLIDVLESTGYDVSEYFGFTANHLHAMLKNNQLDMLIKRSVDGKQVYVKYFEITGKSTKMLRNSTIDDMIEDLFQLENILTKKDDLWIVSLGAANDTITSHLKYLWEHDHIYVNVISLPHLQFNVLEHSMVPNHRIMSKAEIDEFKKKYNIQNNSEIPEISRFDPVSRAIGLRPNQLCEITRSSKNAITALYYRVCVNV